MRTKLAAVLALVIATAAALAATAVAGTEKAAATQAINCKSTLKLALITPLTGDAGFIGQEQNQWGRFGVKKLAGKYGLKVKWVTGDTPVEKGPGEGLVVAQKFIADSAVFASIGPATSGAVAAASKALDAAGLAHISPSATRTSLTKGSTVEASKSFFRVVPDDGLQGPTDANYMVDKLKAKKVVLLDFQEPYSVGLADATEAQLKKRGVTTIRLSTSVNTKDYSSLVTRVPSDADIAFFPTQQPPDAQTFGQQLLEQGKKAKVFGGDGANGPGQFKLPGSYFSNFAPDITGIAANKALLDEFKKDNPGKTVGSFGPPTYVAVEAAIAAAAKACKAGNGQIKQRRDVVKQVKKLNLKTTILGTPFKFSTKTNDPLNGKFFIFQIQSDGSYKLAP